MIDAIKEFWSEMRNRIVNPFLFVYLLVWLGRNWLLMYYLCTDTGHTYEQREHWLTQYLNERCFFGELFLNFIIAVTLIVSFLIFRYITKGIAKYYKASIENKLINTIEQFEVPTSNYLEKLKSQNHRLLEQLKLERESKLAFEEDRDKALDIARDSNHKLAKWENDNKVLVKMTKQYPVLSVVMQMAERDILDSYKLMYEIIKSSENPSVISNSDFETFSKIGLVHRSYGRIEITSLGQKVYKFTGLI